LELVPHLVRERRCFLVVGKVVLSPSVLNVTSGNKGDDDAVLLLQRVEVLNEVGHLRWSES
ncbi:MAG: hypothetical protein ACK55Z_18790, partial [bacterium]